MEGDISKIQFRTPGFEEDAKKLHFTEKQEKICYEAVNMARAVKQGKIKHEE